MTPQPADITATISAAIAAAPDLATIDTHGRTDEYSLVMLEALEYAFVTLARFDTGEFVLDGGKDPETLARIADALHSLSTDLEPRITGLINALIRAHFEAAGTYAALAAALGTSKATAQSRATRVRGQDPDHWEQWARAEHETTPYPATALRPGWTYETTEAERLQVQTVRVYGDGAVEIDVDVHPGGSFCFGPGDTALASPHDLPGMLESAGHFTPDNGPEQTVTTYSRPPRRVTTATP